MSHRHPPSTASDEKYEAKVSSIENVEDTLGKPIDDDSELLLPEVRQYAERKLVRKLDSRVLPTIVLIFILNYIDVSSFARLIFVRVIH